MTYELTEKDFADPYKTYHIDGYKVKVEYDDWCDFVTVYDSDEKVVYETYGYFSDGDLKEIVSKLKRKI